VCRVEVRPEATEAMTMAEHQHLHGFQWKPQRYRRSSSQGMAHRQFSVASHLQVVMVGNGPNHLMRRRLRRRIAAQAARLPRKRKFISRNPSAPLRNQAPWASALRCASVPAMQCEQSDLESNEGLLQRSDLHWHSMSASHCRRPLTSL